MAEAYAPEAASLEIAGGVVAALDDHSGAVAYAGVAGGAVDVVAFLAAGEEFKCDLEREGVAFLAVDEAGVEVGIFVELAAAYGVVDLVTDGATVGEEAGATLGVELGLVVHVLSATCDEGHGCDH